MTRYTVRYKIYGMYEEEYLETKIYCIDEDRVRQIFASVYDGDIISITAAT